MLPKPMIAERVMLGARSHATGLHLGKSESACVVFVDSDVNLGRIRGKKTECAGDVAENVHDWKEIFAGRAKCNIFRLHSRQ